MRTLAWVALLASSVAHAGSFYAEVGGGVAQLRNADTFLPGATPSGGQLNLAADLGFYRTLPLGGTPSELHLGLDLRYESGTGGGDSFAVAAPYFVARFQLSIFYVEGGVAPYLWRRIEPASGFDNLSHVSGLGYMGEGGILWSVTTKFSMGVDLNAQWISAAGVTSPSPILSANGFMRFYFGFSGSGGSPRADSPSSSTEWRGYRYPFGHELN